MGAGRVGGTRMPRRSDGNRAAQRLRCCHLRHVRARKPGAIVAAQFGTSCGPGRCRGRRGKQLGRIRRHPSRRPLPAAGPGRDHQQHAAQRGATRSLQLGAGRLGPRRGAGQVRAPTDLPVRCGRRRGTGGHRRPQSLRDPGAGDPGQGSDQRGRPGARDRDRRAGRRHAAGAETTPVGGRSGNFTPHGSTTRSRARLRRHDSIATR